MNLPFERVEKLVCCPECRTAPLTPADNLRPLSAPFDVTEGLRCRECLREFPCVDGIWVLWSDQVKSLYLNGELSAIGHEAQVKQANIDVYSSASEHYAEHTCPRHLREIRELKALAREYLCRLPDYRRAVVVDVGCATGIGLDQYPADRATIVGVDISLENLRKVDAARFVPILADAERLPFATGSVDLFTCFAALHHFPNPQAYFRSSHECLRPGGMCLTGAEPSRAAQTIGPVARLVFNMRRPVYRMLARWSSRYYLHQDAALQHKNDLAECQRTRGGLDVGELNEMLRTARYSSWQVFLGSSPKARVGWQMPNWKSLVLKALSCQNPFLAANYANVSALGRK